MNLPLRARRTARRAISLIILTAVVVAAMSAPATADEFPWSAEDVKKESGQGWVLGLLPPVGPGNELQLRARGGGRVHTLLVRLIYNPTLVKTELMEGVNRLYEDYVYRRDWTDHAALLFDPLPPGEYQFGIYKSRRYRRTPSTYVTGEQLVQTSQADLKGGVGTFTVRPGAVTYVGCIGFRYSMPAPVDPTFSELFGFPREGEWSHKTSLRVFDNLPDALVVLGSAKRGLRAEVEKRVVRANYLAKLGRPPLRDTSVNAADPWNPLALTPLHRAARGGETEAARLLIEKGANVDATDKSGRTPLHTAAREGRTEVARLLIEKGADVNATDRSLVTPLQWAANRGETEVAKLLIEKGANVDATDNEGQTPLYEAVRWSGSVGFVRLLIEKGADVNAAKRHGWTPLMSAASGGKTEVAGLLIEKGADVNAANKSGVTPLHGAARWGRTDVAKLLIEKGADVNAADHEGQTPLHGAAASGHTGIAKLLIEKGADVNPRDGKGRTPLGRALDNEKTEAAELLRQHGGIE